MYDSLEQILAGPWQDQKGNLFIFSFQKQSDDWHFASVSFSNETYKEYHFCIKRHGNQSHLVLRRGKANFIEFTVVSISTTSFTMRQEKTTLHLSRQT